MKRIATTFVKNIRHGNRYFSGFKRSMTEQAIIALESENHDLYQTVTQCKKKEKEYEEILVSKNELIASKNKDLEELHKLVDEMKEIVELVIEERDENMVSVLELEEKQKQIILAQQKENLETEKELEELRNQVEEMKDLIKMKDAAPVKSDYKEEIEDLMRIALEMDTTSRRDANAFALLGRVFEYNGKMKEALKLYILAARRDSALGIKYLEAYKKKTQK